MIITRLCEYAMRENLVSEPAFYEHEVRFLARLDDEGRFLGLRETQGPVERRGKKEMTRPKSFSVPKLATTRSSAGLARFLVDTISRVVPGAAQKDSDRKTHDDFVRQVSEACLARPDNAALRSALRFLQRPRDDPEVQQLRMALQERKANFTSDWLSFETADGLILEQEGVRAYWRKRFSEVRQAQDGALGTTATCLSCGRVGVIPPRHETKIRGVPGGNPSGVSLISADAPAFESFGLSKSATSPVCRECVEAYIRGLQHLLDGDRTSFRDNDGDVAYVFWTREPTDDDWTIVHRADPADVRKLLESPYRPSERDRVGAGQENAFYALSLSGVGGRAMIRDWIEDTVPRVRENIRQWFLDLTIILDRDINKQNNVVPEGCARGELFSAWPLGRLIRTIGRRQERGFDVPARASSLLFRAAVLGVPLPEDVLAHALGRVRAERSLPPERAALIRLILNRLVRLTRQGGTQMPPQLDREHPEANAGYRCGRLLAVLARLQYRALGETNATIVDRFYGTASSAPASVFPQLMHLHHAHLSKLAATRPGEATNIRKDIEEITTQPEPLMEFPLQLSLQDQGRFALGFYHQCAEYRRRSAEQGGSEGEEPIATQGAMEPQEVE